MKDLPDVQGLYELVKLPNKRQVRQVETGNRDYDIEMTNATKISYLSHDSNYTVMRTNDLQ